MPYPALLTNCVSALVTAQTLLDLIGCYRYCNLKILKCHQAYCLVEYQWRVLERSKMQGRNRHWWISETLQDRVLVRSHYDNSITHLLLYAPTNCGKTTQALWTEDRRWDNVLLLEPLQWPISEIMKTWCFLHRLIFSTVKPVLCSVCVKTRAALKKSATSGKLKRDPLNRIVLKNKTYQLHSGQEDWVLQLT